MTKAKLKVQGMSCGHCVHAVQGALERLDGVRTADVDLAAGEAVVEYDEAEATPSQMVGAIFDEGYTAEELPDPV